MSRTHTRGGPTRAQRRRLRAGGLIATILGACFAPGPAVGVAAPRSGADTAGSNVGIEWAACEGAPGVECGSLAVPLDWSAPDGAQIAVAVARRPADDPARRVGTLFFNPGGPGDGAARYVEAADQIFSDTLRSRFDIVGMDPRGIGDSTPITCSKPVLTPGLTLFPRSRAEFRQLRRHNRRVGESCLESTGPLIGHVDTISVARDHEALRRALDVAEVNWLGLSYGTQVAANYAELYPHRTRAMVLDAALEHSLTEVQQVADEAMAVEDSFNRFVRWCRKGAPGCALRGRKVARLYDRLVARADRHPIPVQGALRPVTGEDIRMNTIDRLVFKHPSIYGPDTSWGGLSRAIRSTLRGDAEPFAQPPADVAQGDLENLLGIGCMEYVPQVHTYSQMRQRIQLGRQIAPHLQGATETWRVNFCINWPIPAANPPRLLHVQGVPALIVHAVHDPSVPYKWAHSLASQIRGSDLLTRTGDGHTSYHTSACARAATDRYLVRPQAPPDRVCRG
jgi:pimeloyl-ACP methyl ester carboxylesterase